MGSVQELMKEYGDFLKELPTGKVQCLLSKHEMPAKLDVLQAYLAGKKFKRLKAKEADKKELKQYEPYLVPSKFLSDKLFCRITGRHVAKTEAAVVRHSEGRRFTTGVEMVAAKKSKMQDEPDPATLKARREEAQRANQEYLKSLYDEARARAAAEEEEEEEEENAAGASGSGKGEVGSGDLEGALSDDDDPDAPDFWVPEWSEEAAALRKRKGIAEPVFDTSSDEEHEEEEANSDDDNDDDDNEVSNAEVGDDSEVDEAPAPPKKKQRKEEVHVEMTKAKNVKQQSDLDLKRKGKAKLRSSGEKAAKRKKVSS